MSIGIRPCPGSLFVDIHRRLRPANKERPVPPGGRASSFGQHAHANATVVRRREPHSDHLILASLNSTCLRRTGSYFRRLRFWAWVLGFFLDRKSVVSGKSVSELVVLGGRR